MTFFYRLGVGVMRLVMAMCFKIETVGKENVPQEGGYLYISNHRSNADPILIGIQNPKTQFCFLAKQELFKNKIAAAVIRNLGAIAVDRGSGDFSPLQEIEEKLKSGCNALVFPEGTRSKDGKLGRFKSGAALIVAQTNVPIIPVAISFDGKLHFRSTIRISYGKPFSVPKIEDESSSLLQLKGIRKEMTQQVSNLLEMNTNTDTQAES
ncbi:MAG: 1-acyl-sn-glycerol-3-phosphate acyltransferase [Oscillospiraceae bacterium]|nr:1-acyl-sn-glycerol-3-phosphate acyltransferase [Oscillospiraceae bacterium]